MTKIYNGIVIDMKTSEVLSHGEVSYVDDVDQMKGGGGSTTTVEKDPRLTDAAAGILETGLDAHAGGLLGKVAGPSGLQAKAFDQAGGVADRQDRIAGDMYARRNTQGGFSGGAGLDNMTGDTNTGQNFTGSAGLDTSKVNANSNYSGLRQGAINDARSALGTADDAAAASGGLGGSRQRLNQIGITNQLSGALGGLDQQAAQQGFQNQLTSQQQQNAGLQQQHGNQFANAGFNNQAGQQNFANSQSQQLANNAVNQQTFGNNLQVGQLNNQASQQNYNNLANSQGAQGAGLGTLGMAGAAQRGIQQEQGDAAAKGLQQLGSLLSGVQGGFGSTQTTSQSGGK